VDDLAEGRLHRVVSDHVADAGRAQVTERRLTIKRFGACVSRRQSKQRRKHGRLMVEGVDARRETRDETAGHWMTMHGLVEHPGILKGAADAEAVVATKGQLREDR